MEMRKAIAAGMVVALGSCMAANVYAADKAWNGTTGDWSVDANWTPGGVPADLDNVTINSGIAQQSGDLKTALGTFDVTGSGGFTVGGQTYIGGPGGTATHLENSTLNIDTTGTITLNGRVHVADDSYTHNATINLNSGTLNVNSDYFLMGGQGGANFVQNGGTFNANVSRGFFFGDKSATNSSGHGTYTLNDGTLNVTIGNDGGDKAFEFKNGDDVFTQNGGVMKIQGASGFTGAQIWLGNGADSHNTTHYYMKNGQATFSNIGWMTIGQKNADATYTQTGGDVSVGINNRFFVNSGSDATGTFNLVGGTFSVDSGTDVSGVDSHAVIIGQNGSGTVNQSGGNFSITNNVVLGDNTDGTGIYNLSGGLLNIAQSLILAYNGTGVFNMTGGELDVKGQGILNDNGTGTFNFSGGKIVLAGDQQDILNQSWFKVADGVTPTVSFANDVTTISATSAVPEPATLALLGLGGLVLASRRRRREVA